MLLAASSLLEGIGGLYFEDCNEAQQVTERSGNFIGGYATHAVDPESAERPLELIPETDFVERVLGGGATGLSSLPSGLGRTLPGGLQPVLEDRATANFELAVATSIYRVIGNLTGRGARAPLSPAGHTLLRPLSGGNNNEVDHSEYRRDRRRPRNQRLRLRRSELDPRSRSWTSDSDGRAHLVT